MASPCYRETELLGEPSLDEILAEPIVQLFMKRDGIDAAHMRGQFQRLMTREMREPLYQ